MSTTSKNKILLITVVVLLLTNIAMLFLFLNKGPEKRGPHGGKEAMMTEFLEKEIGFTAQQLQQYDTLSKQHKENLKATFDEMRNSKSQLFRELGSNAFSDSAIIQAAGKSSDRQKQMEIKMLMHFKAIRNLCTPVQQPVFDSLFYKVWDRKGDGRNKPGQ